MHEEREALGRIEKVLKEMLAVQYEVRGRLNRILALIPAPAPKAPDTPNATPTEPSQS